MRPNSNRYNASRMPRPFTLTGSMPAREIKGTNTANAETGTCWASALAFKNTTRMTVAWNTNDRPIDADTTPRAVRYGTRASYRDVARDLRRESGVSAIR